MKKREGLARGVGGSEFVHFVRSFVCHKFTARMSWQREISSQSYFTLLIMSDTIICARRSVFYRVACTDAAPSSRAKCVVLSRNITRSRNGFVISTCSR